MEIEQIAKIKKDLLSEINNSNNVVLAIKKILVAKYSFQIKDAICLYRFFQNSQFLQEHKLVKLLTVEHLEFHYDNWGIGQFERRKIYKMLNIGNKLGIYFTFAKKVTAMDDIDWKEQTITADDNHLFVFPQENVDLTEFWQELENKK